MIDYIVVDDKSPPNYPIRDILMCMRTSSAMLAVAEGGKDKYYKEQAEKLRAAAEDLERRIISPTI